jgi:hypothetical protein
VGTVVVRRFVRSFVPFAFYIMSNIDSFKKRQKKQQQQQQEQKQKTKHAHTTTTTTLDPTASVNHKRFMQNNDIDDGFDGTTVVGKSTSVVGASPYATTTATNTILLPQPTTTADNEYNQEEEHEISKTEIPETSPPSTDHGKPNEETTAAIIATTSTKRRKNGSSHDDDKRSCGSTCCRLCRLYFCCCWCCLFLIWMVAVILYFTVSQEETSELYLATCTGIHSNTTSSSVGPAEVPPTTLTVESELPNFEMAPVYQDYFSEPQDHLYHRLHLHVIAVVQGDDTTATSSDKKKKNKFGLFRDIPKGVLTVSAHGNDTGSHEDYFLIGSHTFPPSKASKTKGDDNVLFSLDWKAVLIYKKLFNQTDSFEFEMVDHDLLSPDGTCGLLLAVEYLIRVTLLSLIESLEAIHCLNLSNSLSLSHTNTL